MPSPGNPGETTVNPPPVDPYGPDFAVDNKWQCTVDGVLYTGTIDTSFTRIHVISSTYADTTVYLTGSSADKKANIRVSVTIARKSNSTYIYGTDYNNASIMFDTTGSDYLTATNNAAFAVRFELDSFRSNKIKATFKGNAINITNYHSTIHTITDGKFSCEFGKGTKEPKFFSFVDDRDTVPGVIDYARITSNSLIIDGFAFFENVQTSRLIIYTGGTIKPGTYESKKGDVGFEYYRPSSFRDYINDTMGNLSVTIKLMTGNVVEGSFTGTNGYYNSPVSGSFVARVKNYVPEKDLENRWRFTEDADEFNYNIFGGNIRSAAKSSAGGKYYLKLKGESDNGRSTFSLQLSSDSPITTGLYQVNNFSKNFDSLYFKSETKIWNGNPTYFYVNSSNPAYCQIYSIDDHTVSGTLFGKIIRYFKEGAIAIEDMRNASFTASF